MLSSHSIRHGHRTAAMYTAEKLPCTPSPRPDKTRTHTTTAAAEQGVSAENYTNTSTAHKPQATTSHRLLLWWPSCHYSTAHLLTCRSTAYAQAIHASATCLYSRCIWDPQLYTKPPVHLDNRPDCCIHSSTTVRLPRSPTLHRMYTSTTLYRYAAEWLPAQCISASRHRSNLLQYWPPAYARSSLSAQ
jgi:hypothetical protein